MSSKSKEIKNSKQTADTTTKWKKHRNRYIAIFSIVALLLIELTTGSIRYVSMTVICLHPPITGSRFAAGYHYFKPGQPYYGPSAFEEYYCTEEQAKNAGLNPGF